MGRIDEYRAERAAQGARFEAAVGGGISVHDTHTREYRDYFGVGECAGRAVERRVTLKSWLLDNRSEQPWLDPLPYTG